MAPYIPPGLRNRNQSDSKPELPPPETPPRSNANLTLDEINSYFWPIPEPEDDNDNGSSPVSEQKGRTLHDSAKTPGKLAFLLLYWQANPRWETDHIIFTKSSLDLLPRSMGDKGSGDAREGAGSTGISESEKVASDNTSTSHSRDDDATQPIAVFRQMTAQRVTRGYKFEGWYKVECVAYLEPYSVELVRMLEQKWSRTDRSGKVSVEERSGDSWQKSLGIQWAVLKLAEGDVTEKDRGTPNIERLADGKAKSPRTPRKSVNEMLAEMRLKDSGTDAAATGT